MRKYITNLLLAGFSSIFFYYGAQAYNSASESSEKAAEITRQTYQEQHLKDANIDRTIGTGRCGIGGLFLVISGVNAVQRRREEKELEERLKEA